MGENDSFCENFCKKENFFQKLWATKFKKSWKRNFAKFREKRENFCLFSLFAKMKKGVFVSTLFVLTTQRYVVVV
jgi:hypothetical protein